MNVNNELHYVNYDTEHSMIDLAFVYVLIAILCAIMIGAAVAITVWQAHEQEERRRNVMSSIPVSA